IGFDTMIFLAALQSIPEEYYEAANIDGASAVQRLRYITLPLLNPQIIMVCILELIFNFKIFDQVYATTQGGPAGASQTIIMLLYDTAFKYFRFGDASVMAVFAFTTLMTVTLPQWHLVRKPIEFCISAMSPRAALTLRPPPTPWLTIPAVGGDAILASCP